MRSVAVVLALVVMGVAAPADGRAAVIYAGPDGSGSACTASDPCSVTQAQHTVRPGGMVQLAGGTYRLDAPLRFTAADPDVTWQAAPGAHPVLTGARRVTGWTEYAPRVWRARVGDARSRQLVVDGVRGLLAQRSVTASRYVRNAGGFRTSDPDFVDVAHRDHVVLAMNNRWKSQRCPVTGVSGAQVDLAQPCWHDAQIQGPSFTGPSWLEGVPEFIDHPGEFAIQDGWLYYLPRTGQDLRRSDVELGEGADRRHDAASPPALPQHPAGHCGHSQPARRLRPGTARRRHARAAVHRAA